MQRSRRRTRAFVPVRVFKRLNQSKPNQNQNQFSPKKKNYNFFIYRTIFYFLHTLFGPSFSPFFLLCFSLSLSLSVLEELKGKKNRKRKPIKEHCILDFVYYLCVWTPFLEWKVHIISRSDWSTGGLCVSSERLEPFLWALC